MNEPITIISDSFQSAWANAVIKLKENNWDFWNLVVQIQNIELINTEYHKRITEFAKSSGMILPNQVAYTIFPFKLYKPGRSREELYKKYKLYYDKTRDCPHSGWGTYFNRMIHYCPDGNKANEVDQLGSIIDSINKRKVNYGASYVMVIPYPKSDIKKKMGAPCLNYVTIQVENINIGNKSRAVNLLAVYRNHDFLERAYGNYYGLCKLLQYIASETSSAPGRVTCISSHAYVQKKKACLLDLANSYRG